MVEIKEINQSNKISDLINGNDVIFFKDDILDRLKKIKKKNLVIISDFDYTLSQRFDENGNLLRSSFGTVEHWDRVTDDFKKERLDDVEFYSKKEMDLNLPVEDRRRFCEEWTLRGISELSKQNLVKKDFSDLVEIVTNNKTLRLRKHADKIFQFALDNEIPFYVLSAGLGTIIDLLLTNEVPSYTKLKEKNLVTLVSNFILFDENDKVKGYSSPLLNTFSKVDVSIFI